MKIPKKLLITALCAGAGVCWADSITPSDFSATIAVGGSVTLSKTVTVNAGTPTTSQVDVYFLADTTGSMGGSIASVKASAGTILSTTAGLGNVAFGVGEYKDIGDVYEYRLNTPMTTVQATAQAGINAWGASGGGDTPEAQLQALALAASQPATGWRAGSSKLLVWFGDAPGHDPSGSSATTLAQAVAALNAKSIKVEALDVGNLNQTGQASALAAATGGTLTSGVDPTTIVAAIQAAITSSFDTYSQVTLDVVGLPAGVGLAWAPSQYSGAFDRSIDRTFGFDVTFTGLEPGTYDFTINALVNGGIVATETDHIVVEGTSPPGVPDGGATLMLLGLAGTGLGFLRRKLS